MARKKRRKMKNSGKVFLAAILGLIVIFLLLTTREKQDNKSFNEQQVKENKLSLIMAGDVLIHSSVYDDAYEDGVYNFDKMVTLIKPIVSKYDLAFYNQESILGGTKLGLSSYPAFNSPHEVGETFTNIGFNLVNLANNHTLDRGKKAIISSNNYWKTKKNVLTTGSYNSEEERNNIKIQEVNGIKYALLGYTTTTNEIKPSNNYYVNVYSEEQVKKDINSVKDKVDLLLVSMHWGEEYNNSVTKEQESIAKYLSSLGVDIIIGHHPHVVGPIDYVGNTLVIYSLGNFISGQEGMDRRIGLMVSVDVKKGNDDIIISEPVARLTYTYYNSGKTKTDFKIYPFDKLNNKLLQGYKSYYNEYMDLITSRSAKIKKYPI